MATQRMHKIATSDRKFRDDPWSIFTELREEGEVIRVRMPFIGKTWAATTYDAVNEVFKDSERFARDPANAGRKNFIPMQWMFPRSLIALATNMLSVDGTDHRRLRSIVDQAFTMRNIDGMSEQIRRIAEEQMDVATKMAELDGQVDLIEHYAAQIPLTTICELLGLPMEDRPQFREWFRPFSGVTSLSSLLWLGFSLRKIIRYLKEQFEVVKREPRPGLMTQLVQAEHKGERLNETELVSMVFLLLAAGHETTVHLISNSLFALLRHPSAKEELMSDWSLSDQVSEEALRYASPLQMGKPRYVTQDMDFRGATLTKGEMITPLIASANYDPARFENPCEFNIHRPKNYHMSFGSGAHTCLGMKLARTENHHALKSLLARWPNLQTVFDLDHPDWSKRIATRGFKSFFVKPS